MKTCLRLARIGVVAAAFVVPALLHAQATPAVPASQAPAPTATPAAPAPEPYTYNPDGRRDPFVSLMRGGGQRTGGPATSGLGSLTTGEVVLKGVLRSQGAYLALVQGPEGRTFTARVNDRLIDGAIKSIDAQGLVIVQEVNDPLSLIKQREVRKGLRAEDVKP